MPKRAAHGAARPFRYKLKRTRKLADGTTETYYDHRWKVNLVIGKDEYGKEIRKTITARTAKECQEKVNDARKQLLHTGTITTGNKTPTFLTYSTTFLNAKEHAVSPNTYKGYATVCRQVNATYGGVRLTSFTPSMIREMMHQLWGERSLSIKRKAWTTLNQVFQYALEDGIIQSNPMGAVRHANTGSATPQRQAFSVPELQAMLTQTGSMPFDKTARMWFRIFTGARQGEICGATLEDLHLDPPYPHYVLSWSLTTIPQTHGCGTPTASGEYPCGKTKGAHCTKPRYRVPDGFVFRPLRGQYCLKLPKSGKPRTIPLVPELVVILRRYLEYTKDWPNPYGLLFRRPDGDIIDANTDTEDFKALLAACGMDPNTRFGHETRHSVVTLLRRAGMDPKAIMEIVGHSTLTVDDMYMHVDEAQAADTIGALSQALHVPKGMLPSPEE